jgi:general secretion pathway protein D
MYHCEKFMLIFSERIFMKLISLMTTLAVSLSVFAAAPADKKIKMNFVNEDLTNIIQAYSKASEQNFIIDPGVRGKVSILNSDAVDVTEAYNQLSSALAVNGYAISKQENSYIVKPARNVERDLIEVSADVPALKPERLVTWVVTFKNLSAKTVLREMRNLTSKDGEMNLSTQSNQIVMTDWASNLNRVAKLFEQMDKPVDPKLHKLVEQNKKSE